MSNLYNKKCETLKSKSGRCSQKRCCTSISREGKRIKYTCHKVGKKVCKRVFTRKCQIKQKKSRKL